MATIFGSARIDENGGINGGAEGDQTGKEVSTQNFYMHKKGWIALRAKDNAIAKKLATAMQNACSNNNIGYNQGERQQVVVAVKKYGNLKAIKEKVNSDCSSLVRACCLECGIETGNFNTANEATALLNTGKFGKVIIVDETDVRLGDILVTKTKGHTGIIVETDNRDIVLQRSETFVMEVTASSLNLRSTAGTSGQIVAVMERGDRVAANGAIANVNGRDWYFVAFGLVTGWACGKFLK